MMKWDDLYRASGERAGISPKLDCQNLFKNAVEFFLSANGDSQLPDGLIDRIPKHIIEDIDSITQACLQHIISMGFEEPDSVPSLSALCACYGLCLAQTNESNISFSSYDEYYDRAENSLGFAYDPDCCDKCQVPEYECSIDECEQVKRHNAFIMLLRNAIGGSALEILCPATEEEKAAAFELYKASILYGVIIGIYYIQDQKAFDVE